MEKTKLIYLGRDPVPITEVIKCFKSLLEQDLIEFETYQNAPFYSFYQVSIDCFLIKDCFNDMRFVKGYSHKQALKNYINMALE